MTPTEQKEFWLRFHRFQMRYELMFTQRINRALRAQVQDYISTQNLMNVNSAGLYLVLMDLWETTGTAWAYNTRSMLRTNKAGGQMGFSERIVRFMQQYFSIDLLNDAENITRTTIRLIQDVLTEAAFEGWDFDEMVKRMVAPGFTAKRARLIARTETVGAANAASIANARASGLDLNKIWIAARDNRTRLHHKEVNQTVIPLNDLFHVGTDMLDYPGDKERGSAAEVCNCRCAIAFIPI